MEEPRFDYPDGFAQFDVHHWADWVELCCVESLDSTLSRKDIEKRVNLKRGLRSKKTKLAEIDPEKAGRPEEDEDINEKEDNLEEVGTWFQHLETRSKFFGDAYPFSVTGNRTKLEFATRLTESQWVYLGLLMMANLHYFGAIQNPLTADFEAICAEALKFFLPPQAQVHVFGKGRAAASRYQGNIFERIKTLAEDLNGNLLAKPESFPSNSTGDGGLDLVGWVPFPDPAPGRFAIFGQCACTPDWINKQHTSAPQSWCAEKFTLQLPPTNAVFTPYYLRDLEGKWHRPSSGWGPYLHVDRLRLMSIFKICPKDFSKYRFIQEAQNMAQLKATPY